MPKFSFYSATIGGQLLAIKDKYVDKSNNPSRLFTVLQTNSFQAENDFPHWIKAWGATKVKQIENIPIGSNIVVSVNGEPYKMKTHDGTLKPSMQYQATKIIYIPDGSARHQQQQHETTEKADNPQADVTDNVPF